MSHLVTPFLSLHKQEPPISKISSKSSTTNSLANFDSSYTGFSPFVKNLNKEKTTTHRFRADLSDSVSIPKRGTSSGSYGKREQEHSKLLDELDSLFPASSNKNIIRDSIRNVDSVIAANISLAAGVEIVQERKCEHSSGIKYKRLKTTRHTNSKQTRKASSTVKSL